MIGEEGGPLAGSSGVVWMVDPIDGTTEYLYDRPNWAVSVAAVRERDGVVLAGAVHEPSADRVTEARSAPAHGATGGGSTAARRPTWSAV